MGLFVWLLFVFRVWTVAAFFGAHHVPNLNELALFFEYLSLGTLVVLFLLGSLHCFGAVCAPPLARRSCFLESLAGGRFS